MARTVGIGLQDFEKVVARNVFYVDKTAFIKEWWESGDDVTLITRPRRFGKTLTMSMIEYFFSVSGQGNDLFKGMYIWENEEYRKMQGTYPVISLSFSSIKEVSFIETRKKICKTIQLLYRKFEFLLGTGILSDGEKEDFCRVSANMEDYESSLSLQQLSAYLCRYYGKKVIILLDEYDTPMQEAYLNGYWEELSIFMRNLFNATFKGNPYLERAIMTGITRVSKESIFSDLNNLKVVSATSNEYADCFGFTEEEVFEALAEFGLSNEMQSVKAWFDGFVFGDKTDIYNPWSILNYLDTKKLSTYWANTSSNGLIGKLIREGSKDIKQDFELLLCGGCLKVLMDEQVVYSQLSVKESSIWSLFLASGYLKVAGTELVQRTGRLYYYLELTNKEVHIMFENMVHGWFSDYDSSYNDFIKAFLADDIKAMNLYMNRVALATFSFFDSGRSPSAENEPERLHGVKATTKSLIEPNSSVCFYHGFVLGLIVDLEDRYVVTSNRESGFGRYDVLLEPKHSTDDAIILEFKVQDTEEKELSVAVQNALQQIEDKKYAAALVARGVPENKIRKYGFAFHGKKVLIGN